MKLAVWLPGAFLAALLAGPTSAQDGRAVREPVVPPAAVTLRARLTAPAGVLSDADEQRPDTARIQAAIDGCPAGRSVRLSREGASDVFLSGPLRLRAGVVLVIEAATALFASRDPRVYDVEPGSCGILAETGERGPGCRPLILAEDAPGSGIMGRGAIDGRGGAVMRGADLTWWELAKKAKVLDLQQTCPRLVVARRSNGFVACGLSLRNSPNFHLVAEQLDGFTAWGLSIRTPKTARNSDGIDPSSSRNVTITHCRIDTGDDDVAIKAGRAGPTTQVTIAHNHFWNGHGMSIGSNTDGGVRAVRVSDLTIEGADNGLRIKSDRSRGGVVEDVHYQDVCMREVMNPIVLTTMYTTFPGTLLPTYRDIRLKDVRSTTGGWTTLLGLDPDHRIGLSLDNVHVDGQRPEQATAAQVEVRIGPRRGSFVPRGDSVLVDERGSAPGPAPECEGRFGSFRDPSAAPSAAVRIPPEDTTLYVAASGTGDYWSIQRAIDVAPAEGATISVAPGTYRESLRITKPNLRLRSPYADPRRTVISGTVEVQAGGFRLENLSVGVEGDGEGRPPALRVTEGRARLANVLLRGATEGPVEVSSLVDPVLLTVTNPIEAARQDETIEVRAAALAGRLSPADLAGQCVSDLRGGQELLAQAVDEDGDGSDDLLVFQADFAPRESRRFALSRCTPRPPRREDFRVYGRFVRERHDDFAWENDRVAFRVYGPALETFAGEPLTSSAVDVWSKGTRRLVIDDWYLVDDYHRDHGEGGDFYPAGRSRGCGGSGLLVDGVLAVARNFRESRVLARGPIRLVFELTYPLWQDERRVSETKRVTLDAGSHFNRFESRYRLETGKPVDWVAGIRKAEGAQWRLDPAHGFVRSWEFQGRYGDGGWLGCAVLVEPARLVELREADGNQLLVGRAADGEPAVWYAGAGWDRSGDFADVQAWDREVEGFARRLASPLRVEVEP